MTYEQALPLVNACSPARALWLVDLCLQTSDKWGQPVPDEERVELLQEAMTLRGNNARFRVTPGKGIEVWYRGVLDPSRMNNGGVIIPDPTDEEVAMVLAANLANA